MKLQRAKGWSTLSAISPTLKIILDNLPEKTATILDVGCGEGIYGAILTSVNNLIYVDGVDVYKSDIVGAVYDVFWKCTIQEYLEMPNRLSYDMVLALHILEHLPIEKAIDAVNSLKESCPCLLIGLPNSRKEHVYKGTGPDSHKWGIQEFPFEELELKKINDTHNLWIWRKNDN